MGIPQGGLSGSGVIGVEAGGNGAEKTFSESGPLIMKPVSVDGTRRSLGEAKESGQIFAKVRRRSDREDVVLKV